MLLRLLLAHSRRVVVVFFVALVCVRVRVRAPLSDRARACARSSSNVRVFSVCVRVRSGARASIGTDALRERPPSVCLCGAGKVCALDATLVRHSRSSVQPKTCNIACAPQTTARSSNSFVRRGQSSAALARATLLLVATRAARAACAAVAVRLRPMCVCACTRCSCARGERIWGAHVPHLGRAP